MKKMVDGILVDMSPSEAARFEQSRAEGRQDQINLEQARDAAADMAVQQQALKDNTLSPGQAGEVGSIVDSEIAPILNLLQLLYQDIDNGVFDSGIAKETSVFYNFIKNSPTV